MRLVYLYRIILHISSLWTIIRNTISEPISEKPSQVYLLKWKWNEGKTTNWSESNNLKVTYKPQPIVIFLQITFTSSAADDDCLVYSCTKIETKSFLIVLASYFIDRKNIEMYRATLSTLQLRRCPK